MYRKGDAEINHGSCTNDDCLAEECGHPRDVTDTGEDSYSSPAPAVELPHRCDAWTIGGRAEVEQMISDLTGLLAELPARKDTQ